MNENTPKNKPQLLQKLQSVKEKCKTILKHVR